MGRREKGRGEEGIGRKEENGRVIHGIVSVFVNVVMCLPD